LTSTIEQEVTAAVVFIVISGQIADASSLLKWVSSIVKKRHS
jgi:hypothetical protein